MTTQLRGRPLPMSLAEAAELGWDGFDVILVSPDAYVDHPAFGVAVIGRVLAEAGFRVGILAQPDWRSADAFRALGRPRLFFGVAGGNVDSMVLLYTALRKRRNDDAYSPGGKAGGRPERPTLVYSLRLREAWPEVPQVLGGIEASLRRFAHYDYWDDAVRRPLLVDSAASLAVYGMGEAAVVAVARRLAEGESIDAIVDVPGTVVKTKAAPRGEIRWLPDAEASSSSPEAYLTMARLLDESARPGRSWPLAQKAGGWLVVENPPPPPAAEAQLDAVYDLPYTRRWHPAYDDRGGVPALETVRFSVTSHRGCFGDCSFCALALHQGRAVQSRSEGSIVAEVELLARLPEFRGHVHDVGGPTANMYGLSCTRHGHTGSCRDRRCLVPSVCPRLATSQRRWAQLLGRIRRLPRVKRVTVGSGCRHDLLLLDDETFAAVVAHHVSGQMKVAPEHLVDAVTTRMGKPPGSVYRKFRARFDELTAKAGLRQFVIPYLMSGHPGCSLDDMVALVELLTREWGWFPEQVQDFTPTPMSRATAMYHTGRDPLTGDTVPVARDRSAKELQRALLQPHLPPNRRLALKALESCARGRALLASGEARRLWPFLFRGGAGESVRPRRPRSPGSPGPGRPRRGRRS